MKSSRFKKNSPKEATGVGKLFVFLLFAVLLVLFSFFAIVLVPILLVAGSVYLIWQKMITSRVGNVEVKTPHIVVAPGEEWPLELCFTPRKSFAINGITVKLFAQESATSGSGTNKTTHRHTVFEEVHTLEAAGMLAAGQPVRRQLTVAFPKTEAYSFEASDNEVEWSAEIRIDMPGFPDWKKKQDLQVVPREFLADARPRTAAVEARLETASELQEARETASEWLDSSPSPEHSPVRESAAAEEAVGSAPLPTIVSVIRQILQASRFGNERNDLAAQARGQEFDMAITIDRIASTLGSTEGERYANGKTITGTVVGTDHSVQLFTASDSNRHVDGLARGDQWTTRASVSQWDSLYDRLVLVEAPTLEKR